MNTYLRFLFATVLLFAGCHPSADQSADDAEWEAQQKRTNAQLDDYDRQTRRVDEFQAKTDDQLRRLDTIIEKWEEQARRYDAILDAMEKQQGLKK
jgi:septal ring factor EnvC (AmiA/AmiB activator)